MARVSVEQRALSDPRFQALADFLNLADRYHALGKMIQVWNECIERESYTLPRFVLVSIFGSKDAARAVVKADLAEPDPEHRDRLRIKGTKDRVEYLATLRKSNRERKALQRSKNTESVTRDMSVTPHVSQGALTLTPAPAPTSSQSSLREDENVSVASQPHPYPPGFERAWKAYPHFEQRSRKAHAAKVWKRRQLEPLTESVLAWIVAGRETTDWTKESGAFVSGMQAWLSGPDFRDPPPEQDLEQPALSDVTRHNLAVARRFIERGQA